VSATTVFFYLYAAVAIAGAVGLVAARRLVHAVMSLFATLFSIAALYLLLGSEFLAAMQLFVYGGAITVLALFVLMLTRPDEDQPARSSGAVRWIAAALCVAFFGVLAATLGTARWQFAAEQPQTTESLATILFSRYVLPFEIAGLVLTIALIGAIVLAREDDVLGEEPATGDTETADHPVGAEEAGAQA
jgi:NADH-quinone oxidoreductase subunit J